MADPPAVAAAGVPAAASFQVAGRNRMLTKVRHAKNRSGRNSHSGNRSSVRRNGAGQHRGKTIATNPGTRTPRTWKPMAGGWATRAATRTIT